MKTTTLSTQKPKDPAPQQDATYKVSRKIIDMKSIKSRASIINQKHPQVNTISNKKGSNSIILLDSPLGTGKTYWANQYINKPENLGRNVTYISPSISLAEAASKTLNIKSYLKFSDKTTSNSRISICCNSIRLLPPTLTDILIIDEPDQVLGMLLGPTIKEEQRGYILKTLVAMIKNSNTCLIMQHKMTDDILNVIEQAERLNDVQIYLNEYKPFTDLEVTEIEESTYAQALNKLKAACTLHFAKKEKFMIASSSKKKATEVGLILNKMNMNGLVINSDNANEDKQKEFFLNPTKESEKYDYIIYSPKMTSGVSIENNDYKHTYGIFMNAIKGLAPKEFMQMLFRNRKATSITYWAGFKKMDLETNKDKLMTGIIQLNRLQLKYVQDGIMHFEPYELKWQDYIKLNQTARLNSEKSNAGYFLNESFSELGVGIMSTTCNDIDKVQGKKINALAKQERLKQELKAVVEAEGIDNDQATILKDKKELSSKELWQLKRYISENRLGINYSNLNKKEQEKQYLLDQVDDIPTKAMLIETGSLKKSVVKNRVKKIIENDQYPLSGLGSLFVKREVLHALMKHMQISLKSGVIQYNTQNRFKLTDLCIGELANKINENKHAINQCGLGGLIKNKLTSKILGLWIRKMGISIKPYTTKDKNGKSQRYYKVKSIQAGLKDVLMNRHKANVSMQSILKVKSMAITTEFESTEEYINRNLMDLGIVKDDKVTSIIDQNIGKIFPLEIMDIIKKTKKANQCYQ